MHQHRPTDPHVKGQPCADCDPAADAGPRQPAPRVSQLLGKYLNTMIYDLRIVNKGEYLRTLFSQYERELATAPPDAPTEPIRQFVWGCVMGHRFIEACSPDPPEGMKCRECDATAVPLIDLDAPPVPQEAAPEVYLGPAIYQTEQKAATAPDEAMRVAEQITTLVLSKDWTQAKVSILGEIAALIRQAGSERERELREALRKVTDQLKGYRNQFDRPYIAEASRLLGGESNG